MKMVILSAGEGKRLRPLTLEIPKVMIPIAGKPLLEHLILLCKKHGADEVFLNLFYLPDKVISYFSNKDLGIKISWKVFKKLVNASEALLSFRDELTEDFPVLYGDIASNLNIKKVLEFHRKKKALATLVLQIPQHPEDSDLLELNKNCRIVKFHQKSPFRKINNKKMYFNNAGTVVFSPKIFDYIIKRGLDPNDSISHSLLTKIINKKNRVFGYVTKDFMEDIGTPKRYKLVSHEYNPTT